MSTPGDVEPIHLTCPVGCRLAQRLAGPLAPLAALIAVLATAIVLALAVATGSPMMDRILAVTVTGDAAMGASAVILRRQMSVKRWAHKVGWNYAPTGDRTMMVSHLAPLHGKDGRITDLVAGRHQGRDFVGYQYTCQPDPAGKEAGVVHVMAAYLSVGPLLDISRTPVLQPVLPAADLAFTGPAFASTWRVTGQRTAAVDLLTPAVVDVLTAAAKSAPDVSFRFEGRWLMAYAPGVTNVAALASTVDLLGELADAYTLVPAS